LEKINLEKEILERFLPIIKSWKNQKIYVISFYVYDNNDDPCKPTVLLGYNTEEDVEHNLLWTDEQEARWNYAFWRQNRECVIGCDKETEKIIKQWVSENKHHYIGNTEESENQDFDQITTQFVEVLINVVKEIHSYGFLTEVYGKEIPILIHELEYYDEIAIQNMKANGVDCIKDFIDFCGYKL
jgi:hypothetical protein